MKFHPAAWILAWCLLVAAMQIMPLLSLLCTASLILLLAVLWSVKKFIKLIRRTRWVIVSLLLVYAYSTHGEALITWMGAFSPSREGVLDGVLQLTRLLAALAGLAILLDKLDRLQLIAGLYALFAPLQWLGFSRERLAVRLALTLQYAEQAMLRNSISWQDTLNRLPETQSEITEQIELPLYRFTFGDALLIVSALLILWLASK